MICFQSFTTNKAVINNLRCISFCTCVVYLWDKFPDVVLLGQSIFAFVILADIMALHRGCTNINSHQQCTKGPVCLQPCQQSMFLIFWIFANLISKKWDHSVISISISLIMYELCFFSCTNISNEFSFLFTVCSSA